MRWNGRRGRHARRTRGRGRGGSGSCGSVLIVRGRQPVTLLNVSYDPTREFYQDDQRRVREGVAGRSRPAR